MRLTSIFASLLFLSSQAATAKDAAPPSPYIMDLDEPGHLKYNRQWKLIPEFNGVKEPPREVYKAPTDKTVIGVIEPGESFTAVKGQLHVIPQVLRVTRKHTIGSKTFTPDAKVYLLGHKGEGWFSIWSEGTIYSTGADEIFAKDPDLKKQGFSCPAPEKPACWLAFENGSYSPQEWIEVRTKRGINGWIKDNRMLDPGN